MSRVKSTRVDRVERRDGRPARRMDVAVGADVELERAGRDAEDGVAAGGVAVRGRHELVGRRDRREPRVRDRLAVVVGDRARHARADEHRPRDVLDVGVGNDDVGIRHERCPAGALHDDLVPPRQHTGEDDHAIVERVLAVAGAPAVLRQPHPAGAGRAARAGRQHDAAADHRDRVHRDRHAGDGAAERHEHGGLGLAVAAERRRGRLVAPGRQLADEEAAVGGRGRVLAADLDVGVRDRRARRRVDDDAGDRARRLEDEIERARGDPVAARGDVARGGDVHRDLAGRQPRGVRAVAIGRGAHGRAVAGDVDLRARDRRAAAVVDEAVDEREVVLGRGRDGEVDARAAIGRDGRVRGRAGMTLERGVDDVLAGRQRIELVGARRDRAVRQVGAATRAHGHRRIGRDQLAADAAGGDAEALGERGAAVCGGRGRVAVDEQDDGGRQGREDGRDGEAA